MIKGYYDVIKCKLNIPTIQPKLQMKEITPSTEEQYIIPDEGYDGLASAMVKAVTNEIDPNILPENIRLGKSILGISGNLEPDKPDQSKTVTPSTVQQVVVADTGYELAQVTVEAVPDETPELNAQDTLLENQETLIGQLESALDDKIALDLQAATSDATATANDIAKDKTAYVSGQKITGTYEVPTPTLELYDVLDLQHTGVASYDTDYIPNENTEIFVEYEDWHTYVYLTNTVNLFGVRYGTRQGRATSSTWTNACGFGSYYNGNFKFGNKELRTPTSNKLADVEGKIRLKLNKNGMYKYNYNTSEYETIALFDSTPTVDTMQHTIALFEEKQIMTIIDPQETYINHNNGNPQALKFHFMEIYENGVLKARYVPAKYGNEIGVYDTVAQKMLDRITPLDVYNENN